MPDDRDPRTPTSTEDAAGEGGPYRRWSRRKSLARRGAEAEPPAPEAPEAQAAAPDAAEPERALTDADMPALDTLDESSDYSPFMSEGVSEHLRGAALRKLFSSAVFNRLDGLDDYAEDFTSFEPLGDTVTAEMRYRAEVAARRARERAEREAREALAEGAPEAAETMPGAPEIEPAGETHAHAREAADAPGEPAPAPQRESGEPDAASGDDADAPDGGAHRA